MTSDLAIVAMVLAVYGVALLDAPSRTALLGDLGPDGRLRPVPRFCRDAGGRAVQITRVVSR